jgi:hypothetical protein
MYVYSSTFHPSSSFSQASLGDVSEAISKIVQVSLDAIQATVDQIQEVGSGIATLTFTTLRYAFYAVRIPFIYLEYFVHDMVHDSAIAIVGNILYLFSELGFFFKWFDHLKIIDLSTVSSALGKFSVFNSFGICPIDAGLGIISGIASVCYSIDYITQLAKGNLSRQERIAVWFGLSSCIVHIVALTIFFGSGGGFFPVVLGLTAVSVILYMTYWFLHRYPIKCLS